MNLQVELIYDAEFSDNDPKWLSQNNITNLFRDTTNLGK